MSSPPHQTNDLYPRSVIRIVNFNRLNRILYIKSVGVRRAKQSKARPVFLFTPLFFHSIASRHTAWGICWQEWKPSPSFSEVYDMLVRSAICGQRLTRCVRSSAPLHKCYLGSGEMPKKSVCVICVKHTAWMCSVGFNPKGLGWGDGHVPRLAPSLTAFWLI